LPADERRARDGEVRRGGRGDDDRVDGGIGERRRGGNRAAVRRRVFERRGRGIEGRPQFAELGQDAQEIPSPRPEAEEGDASVRKMHARGYPRSDAAEGAPAPLTIPPPRRRMPAAR
jgi:hypothetical protein